MGIKIIKQREHVEEPEFSLAFDLKDDPSCGYSFDCDEAGNVLPLERLATESLKLCQANVGDKFNAPYIRKYVRRYTNPAIALCHCGQQVHLSDPMDNDCTCGRCYNMSGQEVQANYGRAECLADGCAWDENDY